jgi:hypothetical protein
MKKIFAVMSLATLATLNTNAQCSEAKNNFEMKLVHKANNMLSVQMRYNDGAVADAVSSLPTTQLNLDGLVFAITWPTTSQVAINTVTTGAKPFNIEVDKTVGQGLSQNKTVQDNIVTFYHNTDFPNALPSNWKNGEWMSIAEVNYTGNLAANDFFSFVNCDYGLAHPNSYSGNSHTDPWFALIDLKSSVYQQYSPKMITERPSNSIAQSSFNIYPNPTTSEFTVEINTDFNTQVVINVTDLTGKVVSSQILTVAKGLNKTQVNVANLAAGNYLVKVADGKTLNFVQKLEKQ